MFSSIFQSTTIPVLQEVVNFSQLRHTALAGNIANMDTPGYRFRDLSVEDFQERLLSAIQSRHNPPGSQSPGEPGYSSGDPLAQISETPHTILHHDLSNVELENQVTEMVKNQMQHNLAISIMQSQFRLLQTAISERV